MDENISFMSVSALCPVVPYVVDETLALCNALCSGMDENIIPFVYQITCVSWRH
jgi:hypothetical protein